jgi:hypothetical protein
MNPLFWLLAVIAKCRSQAWRLRARARGRAPEALSNTLHELSYAMEARRLGKHTTGRKLGTRRGYRHQSQNGAAAENQYDGWEGVGAADCWSAPPGIPSGCLWDMINRDS